MPSWRLRPRSQSGLSGHGQELSGIAAQAEREGQDRQDQTGGRPQTDDAEALDPAGRIGRPSIDSD
jgi:hypothetical protein